MDQSAALLAMDQARLFGDVGERQLIPSAGEVAEHPGGLGLPLWIAPAVVPLPAVGLHQVEPAVVVQIHRNGTPSPAALLDTRAVADRLVEMVARVSIQEVPGTRCSLDRKPRAHRGDEPVEPAVVVEIRYGCAMPLASRPVRDCSVMSVKPLPPSLRR